MSDLTKFIKIEQECVILKGLIDSKHDCNNIQLALDAGLTAKYFFDPFFREVATFILDNYDEDTSQPDMFEIHDKFDRQGLKRDQLVKVFAAIHEPAHFEKRIAELGRLSRKRDALDAVETAKRMIEADTAKTEDILSQLTERAEDIISDGAEALFYTAKQGMAAVMEDLEKATKHKGMSGLASPYPEMDKMLRGFQAGRVYVIAAESGGGKTVLCLNIASQQANDMKRTAVFSMEMSYRDVWARIAIHNAQVSGNTLAGVDDLTRGDLKVLRNLVDRAETIPIITCDKSGLSVEGVVAALHKEHNKEPLELACIDYVQLMHSRKPHNNREQEIAYISRCLKGVARDLGIAIVLPCQLNDDGKARESRGIKFDSDAFIAIEPQRIVIEKNRVGPTGDLPLEMNGEFQRFDEVFEK